MAEILDHVMQFLFSASPWLFGWVIAFSITHSISCGRGTKQIIFSIAGFSSAVLIVSLHAEFPNQITPDSILTALFFCLAGNAARYALKNEMPNLATGRSVSLRPDLLIICLVFFYAGLVLLSLTQHLLTPLQSWDALQYWAPQGLAEMRVSDKISDAETRIVHPRLIALFLVWNNLAQDGSPQSFQYISWFMLWISYALLVYGFSLQVGCSKNAALLLSLVAMSVPLIENHANRPGYAELALGYVLSGAITLTALGLAAKRTAIWCTGLASSGLLLLLKNTGLFYLVCLWASGLWVLLYHYSKGILLVLLIMLLPSGYALYADGFVFVFSDQVLEWTPWRDYGKFAGRKLDLVNTSIPALLENQIHAWMINQSFGTLFVGIATVAALWCRFSQFRGPAINCILLCTLLGLSGIVLAQFTEYGFRYAVPERDTSASRLAIPIFMLAPLSLALLVAFAESRGSQVPRA